MRSSTTHSTIATNAKSTIGTGISPPIRPRPMYRKASVKMPVYSLPPSTTPVLIDWPREGSSCAPWSTNSMPSVASRSGTRSRTISSPLSAPISRPPASAIGTTTTVGHASSTRPIAHSITVKPALAPIERSKPPMIIETVTPRAMIPTVETDCRIETMLSNERNVGSVAAK